MPYEHKEGWGSVFKNQDKQEGDNKPALKGDGLFEGQKIRLAVWKKQSKNGQIFYSVHMERERPKEEKPKSKSEGVVEPGYDDDIPFSLAA